MPTPCRSDTLGHGPRHDHDSRARRVSAATSGDPSATDDPIVVGVSLPLTGDFSEPGKGVQQGYEAWAKIVNDKGGLLGRQIELKILDDQSNADRVVADYEQLIGKDEVDLVVGPFSTRLVVPAARVAEEYGMLFVEPAGAAKEVFAQGFKNLFYAAPAVADDHYNHLAEHILALPADEAAEDGRVRRDGRPVRPGHRVRPARTSSRPAGCHDRGRRGLPAEHHRLRQHRREDRRRPRRTCVVGGSQYQDGVNLIVALQQLNYQPKLAAFSTAPTNPEFAAAIGNKTEGVLSPTGYSQDAPYPSNKEFVEKYTAQFGKAPEEDQANAYTTGQVVAAAVKAAGCAEQGDVPAEAGRLGPRQQGRHRGRPAAAGTRPASRKGAHMIQQWVGGEIKIVLPADAKEADFRLPEAGLVRHRCRPARCCSRASSWACCWVGSTPCWRRA